MSWAKLYARHASCYVRKVQVYTHRHACRDTTPPDMSVLIDMYHTPSRMDNLERADKVIQQDFTFQNEQQLLVVQDQNLSQHMYTYI